MFCHQERGPFNPVLSEADEEVKDQWWWVKTMVKTKSRADLPPDVGYSDKNLHNHVKREEEHLTPFVQFQMSHIYTC